MAPSAASAATWGGFDASRTAYATGALTGDANSQFHDLITDNGDDVAAGTGEITAEYLDGIDVFYTSMVSDGTGPTAGALGSLSLDERDALADWIADGGTLIVAPDSNGFDGPWAMVYDTYTSQLGVTDYEFVFGPGEGAPFIEHPITEGVEGYSLDSTARFEFGEDAALLGTAVDAADPFLVVFEPATGFDDGGRVLIVADHNALSNTYIGELDNEVLAANIIGWAAGECGNSIVESNEDCDDGNKDDGDGCDATCTTEGGGSTGGGDSTGDGGDSDTGAADETGDDDDGAVDDGGSTDDGPVDPTAGLDGTGGSTGADGSTGGDGGADDDSSGCGCHSQGKRPFGPAALLLLAVVGLRRRR